MRLYNYNIHLQGQRKAQEWHCGFIESSAKNNENIHELFEMVIKNIDAYLGISQPESKPTCSTMWTSIATLKRVYIDIFRCLVVTHCRLVLNIYTCGLVN